MLYSLWYGRPVDKACSRGEPETYLRKPDGGLYELNKSERNLLSFQEIFALSIYGSSCEVIEKSCVPQYFIIRISGPPEGLIISELHPPVQGRSIETEVL